MFSGDIEHKRPLAADFLLFPVIHVNSDTRGTRRLKKSRPGLGGAWGQISSETRP